MNGDLRMKGQRMVISETLHKEMPVQTTRGTYEDNQMQAEGPAVSVVAGIGHSNHKNGVPV